MSGYPGNPRTIHVLHVLGGMERGGAETWLMHVLRALDRKCLQMDFVVHTAGQCAYDAEIRALGARIIPCLNPRRPWTYARQLRSILRQCGPYDVVHSHVHHFTGVVLAVASRAGIPVRIAHSHNDTRADEVGGGVLRRSYLRLTEWGIRRYATRGLAASAKAASSLFGERWQTDPRWKILYCGIDMEEFRRPAPRSLVRTELGLSSRCPVIGHVGRFSRQKNHAFVLDIAVEVARREPTARFLFLGDGPLRQQVEGEARARGLGDRAVFTGARTDVPRLMMGAMDALLFPSLYEGLPLVLLEAQAAGLPAVISDVITSEADVVRPLIRRLALSDPASIWADAAVQAAHGPSDVDQEEALRCLESSPFHIRTSIANLVAEYREDLSNSRGR